MTSGRTCPSSALASACRRASPGLISAWRCGFCPLGLVSARCCGFCCVSLASACCCGFAAQALFLPICWVLLRVAICLFNKIINSCQDLFCFATQTSNGVGMFSNRYKNSSTVAKTNWIYVQTITKSCLNHAYPFRISGKAWLGNI